MPRGQIRDDDVRVRCNKAGNQREELLCNKVIVTKKDFTEWKILNNTNKSRLKDIHEYRFKVKLK